MLSDFLLGHFDEISSRARTKVKRANPERSEGEVVDTLPDVFRRLANALQQDPPAKSHELHDAVAAHAVQRETEGFSIDRIVHDYGVLCDAVTSLAAEHETLIPPNEWQRFNLVLDNCIAESITTYIARRTARDKRAVSEHYGQYVHELRNSLSSARFAVEAIRSGRVGLGGQTFTVLDRAVARMAKLVEWMLEETRTNSRPLPARQRIDIEKLVDDVLASTSLEQGVRLTRHVPERLEVFGDGTLLFSALGNLVQNAIKFTRPSGHVSVRIWLAHLDLVIEVEDECGGLPARLEQLLEPFGQHSENRSGLGLGLTIVKRAVDAHAGTLSVENLPNRGCIFRMTLPAPGLVDEGGEFLPY